MHIWHAYAYQTRPCNFIFFSNVSIVSERKLKIRYFFFKNTKYTRTYTNATLILSLIGIAIKHHSWKKKDENKIIGFHISYFKIKLKVQTVTSRSLHSRNEGKFSTDLSLSLSAHLGRVLCGPCYSYKPVPELFVYYNTQ